MKKDKELEPGYVTPSGDKRSVGVYKVKPVPESEGRILFVIQSIRPINKDDFDSKGRLHNSGIRLDRYKSKLRTTLPIKKESLEALRGILNQLHDDGELK